MSEMEELPKGWVFTKLGELFLIERGGSPRPIEDYITDAENGINWIKIGDTKGVSKYIYNTKEKIKPEGLFKSRMVYVDDFILSNSMSFGHPYIMKTDGCIHDGWLVIRINKEIIDINYLYHILSSSFVYRQFSKLAKGSTVKNLNIEAVNQVYIFLPPYPEQHRIVAKIEELFSSLDKGIESLKTAQAQLKTYRQAVLKWAIEGRLTTKWRAKKANLPLAQEVITKIKNEREEVSYKIQRNLIAIEKISDQEIRILPKLPEEFAWVKLGEVIWSVKDGPHYSPEYEAYGIPFISGGNVRPSGIDFKNSKFISKELHNELSKRCRPEKGDVLYTKGGTTGIARVNNYDCEFNVWVHVAVLKTISCVNPFYLQHALNSHHCYKQSQKYTHGVGNQDLGLTRMVHITLPICSKEEQEAIVSEIETRLSVCDKLEESIAQSLVQSEALRQSILKKAFEGKLVPQDPNDEPAGVLLERIRAERNQAAAEQRHVNSRRTPQKAGSCRAAT